MQYGFGTEVSVVIYMKINGVGGWLSGLSIISRAYAFPFFEYS